MGDTRVWEGERIRAYKRWNAAAVGLCLCFVLGSILFLTNMGRQYTKENLVLLDNAAFQHETALVKQMCIRDRTCKERDVPPEIEKKLKKIHSSSQYLLALILSLIHISNTLYANWLNFYVYQTTPYVLDEEA